MTDNLEIVTITSYDTNDENGSFRYGLAQQTIQNCIRLGYKITVADRSEDTSVKREFKKLGASVLDQERGMGKAKRQVIRSAYDAGRDVITFIEAERYSLIDQLEKAIEPVTEGSADLVVVGRKSLDSYPEFQQ